MSEWSCSSIATYFSVSVVVSTNEKNTFHTPQPLLLFQGDNFTCAKIFVGGLNNKIWPF